MTVSQGAKHICTCVYMYVYMCVLCVGVRFMVCRSLQTHLWAPSLHTVQCSKETHTVPFHKLIKSHADHRFLQAPCLSHCTLHPVLPTLTMVVLTKGSIVVPSYLILKESQLRWRIITPTRQMRKETHQGHTVSKGQSWEL